MGLLKGIHKREAKKPSLVEALKKTYPEVNELSALSVPYDEGSVSLAYRDPDLNKGAIFRVGDKAIEVYMDIGHLRDYTEARRDARTLMERLTTEYADRQSQLRKQIKEDLIKEKQYSELLEDSYRNPSVTEMKKGFAESELSAARRRLAENREQLDQPKPRHNSGTYLALALNKPQTVGLGEVGRILGRLREKALHEFGALPRASEANFNDMIALRVVWNG